MERDGFLGAGTGAFYKLLFVRGLGFSFLHAAAPAKFTNVASIIRRCFFIVVTALIAKTFYDAYL